MAIIRKRIKKLGQYSRAGLNCTTDRGVTLFMRPYTKMQKPLIASRLNRLFKRFNEICTRIAGSDVTPEHMPARRHQWY